MPIALPERAWVDCTGLTDSNNCLPRLHICSHTRMPIALPERVDSTGLTDGNNCLATTVAHLQGDIANEEMAAGSRGLAFARVSSDGAALEGAKALVEGLDTVQTAKLIAAMGAEPEDLLLLAAGDVGLVNKTLDRVRQYVARSLEVRGINRNNK